MQRRAVSDQPSRATLEPTPSQPTPSATPLVTQGISAREQDSAREAARISALEERRRTQDESTYGDTEREATRKEDDAAVLERAQRQRPEVPAGDGAADAGGGGAEKWGRRRSALEGLEGSRSEGLGASRRSALEGVGGSRRTASDACLQESLAEHYYRCQLYLLYLLYLYKSTRTDR